MEIKKISLTVELKRIKHLGINLTKKGKIYELEKAKP